MSPKETIERYYEARNTFDFSEVKSYVDDSLIITEGDFIMRYDQNSFNEVFKWDSVFHTSYKLIGIKEEENHLIASVNHQSVRNTFLKNDSMTCDYKISFKSGKISKIETVNCIDVDWLIWGKERDTLVEWIRINHPKLDGFINDMTMQGAINYVKAIEFYSAR